MARHDSTGRLAPLPDDLAPELRELAEFLRSHFSALNTSVRAYAVGHNWDPGAVSRFLSGDRIPPQSFADALLADAGPQRSPEEVDREMAEAFDLRLNALQVRNARAARSEQITQELAAAEQEISLLRTKERVLTRALQAAEAEHKLLYANYKEMQKQIESGMQQITSGRPSELERIAKARDEARKEVVRLKGELASERSARIEAEERRDALQAELDKADAELLLAGGSALAIGSYSLRRQLAEAIGARRAHWGGMIALIVVPATIYGIPLYLGLIYHTLAHTEEALRITTICTLSIPAWFAWAAQRVGRSRNWFTIKRFLLKICLIALMFFIAALA